MPLIIDKSIYLWCNSNAKLLLSYKPMSGPNTALMILTAQLKLPPEVVFQDPTPSVYILGIRQIPPEYRGTPPPITYCNDNGRMRCWSWDPAQKTWLPIGSHHQPPL